jgi:hypothetical protein
MQDDLYIKFWQSFHFFPWAARHWEKKPEELKPVHAHPLMWVHIVIVCFFLSEAIMDICEDWRSCVIKGKQACTFPNDFPLVRADMTSLRLIIPLALFVLCVWLFERWQRSIPAIFQKLLNTSCLVPAEKDDPDVPQKLSSDKQAYICLKSGDNEAHYLQFLTDYQNALIGVKVVEKSVREKVIEKVMTNMFAKHLENNTKLHMLRVLYVFFFAVVSFGLFLQFPIFTILHPRPDLMLTIFVITGRILILLFGTTFAVLVALGSWIMGVTGTYLTKISSEFSYILRPTHPDGCNGLKWLGVFCLKLALPLLELALTLAGGFLLVNIFPGFDSTIVAPITVISPVFIILLTLIAIYVFFRPLWSIHTQMAIMREKESDNYATRIGNCEDALQNALDKGTSDEVKQAKDRLDIAEQLPNPKDYSTWPLPFFRFQVISFLSPILLAVGAPLIQQILSSVLHK